MDEIIEQYGLQKFVLSLIFNENIVSGVCKISDKKTEELFFNTYSLNYLKDTLEGKDIVYDDNKLDIIKEYMLYFITMYSKDESKKNLVGLCRQIVYLIKSPTKYKLKKYYNRESDIRAYNLLIFDNTKELDTSIALDYKYLDIFISDENVSRYWNDLNCVLSLNSFSYECPILFMHTRFMNNVKKIIELNKKAFSPEVKILTLKLEEFVLNLEKDNIEISTIYKNQFILSLIFSPNFIEEVQMLEDDFYTEERFQIFKTFAIEGCKKCLFDSKKRENMYILLGKISKNLNLTNMEQNDIKLALNKVEDEGWKEKNDAFYAHIYHLHYSKKSRNKILDFDEENRRLIDYAIYFDTYALKIILNLNCDITELVSYDESIYSINYIMNSFPVIVENPIYLDRISNILELNDMIHKNKSPLQIENSRILKKIKKLQK